jgi:Fic family protein
VTVQGAVITLDSVARTLVQLNAGDVRQDTAAVALWLRHAAVTRADLEATYTVNPRPVLLKRMGLLAGAAGNRRLAELVETVLAEHAERPASASTTGIGRTIRIPASLAATPRGATAWLDRHSLMMADYRIRIERAIRTRAAALPRSSLARVLRAAKVAKAYDAYHSTTIEGYRITREMAEAIVAGRSPGEDSLEGLREKAALVGYSAAFDEVTRVVTAERGPVRIDEALIFDLYEALFSPSVDAGLLGAGDLRQWRRQPAYIRGSPHVPPAEGKLPQLMSAFVESVNQDLDVDRAVERAVLAHLDFVTIHPFIDGNGRIGRFLMNVVLTGAGLPWVTIRADQRDRYFGALRRAQPMDGDPGPFARFVFEGIRAATRALTGEAAGGQ